MLFTDSINPFKRINNKQAQPHKVSLSVCVGGPLDDTAVKITIALIDYLFIQLMHLKQAAAEQKHQQQQQEKNKAAKNLRKFKKKFF